MLRLALAGLLTLAALTAATPSASAVYVCGHQNDASDLTIGDDPVWRTHCTTENVSSLDCEATVTVTATGVTYPAGCDFPCNPCCFSCPPPPVEAAAAPLPCSTEGNPFLDAGFGVRCAAAGAECQVAVATFGTLEQLLSPSAGCSTGLWPPYDCVQDCDGPADS